MPGVAHARPEGNAVLKRGTDLVLGSLLALVVTPVVLLLALPVALQFRAWPFFTQHRLGRRGRPFRIVKLRTMPPHTPVYADKYDIRSITLPRLARLLRRYHLDELPQLWLVPIGRMSLVGPRPEMAFLHAHLHPRVASTRLSVRPGCTGLWQVSVHVRALIHEHPEYDLTYVANRSLRLDAWIVWHTVRKLLGRPTELTLESVPQWVTPASHAPATERVAAAARS